MGDEIQVTQEYKGETKNSKIVKVQPSKSDQYEHLVIPPYELWVEDRAVTSDDELQELLTVIKDANRGIENDLRTLEPIKVDFASQSFTLYFNDKSFRKYTSPNFKITEREGTSVTPQINALTVVDDKITVTFESEVEAETKIQFALGISALSNACVTNDCTIDKNTDYKTEWFTIGSNTNSYTYTLNNAELSKLDIEKYIGVRVQEPRKKKQCDRIKPVLKIPKVEVKDPRNLTDADKTNIYQAIRNANTNKKGESKLPSIYRYFDIKDGNVRLLTNGDIASWENGQPAKNDDGTYKTKLEKENTILKMDLKKILRNIRPDAPEIKLDDEDNVVVTPQAVDTDAATITLKYNDPDGNEKTLVATKGDTGTWSVPDGGTDGSVDPDTGAVTLPSNMVENGGTVKATVTDRGGISEDEDDKPAKKSEEASLPLEKKHKVSYDAGEGSGTMEEAFLKKGQTYTIRDNGFTAPEGKEFDHWQVGNEEKHPNDVITIGEDDIVITAIWKTTPTESKKPDTPDDATTPTDTPNDATIPTTTPTPQEPEPTGSTGEPEPTGSSDQPQPTDTVPEPETTNPDVPEDPHSPGNWISPDPSDDWRNQTPLEGQKTPGSVQVIQQQSAPSAAPAPTSTEKNAKGLPRTGENPSLLIQSLAILLAAGGALALMQRRKIRIRR